MRETHKNKIPKVLLKQRNIKDTLYEIEFSYVLTDAVLS